MENFPERKKIIQTFCANSCCSRKVYQLSKSAESIDFLEKKGKKGIIKDVSFAITQIENGNYLITCLFSASIFYLVKSGV